jgi:hypothetical protein
VIDQRRVRYRMTDDEAISLDHLIRPLQEHGGSAVLSDVSLPDAPVDHSKYAIHGTNKADAYGKRNAVEGDLGSHTAVQGYDVEGNRGLIVQLASNSWAGADNSGAL